MDCRWLQTEQVGPVTCVRFTRPVLLEGDDAETAAEYLLSLVADAGCCRFVVNLERVESLSSSMLGKLITLHKKALPLGGRLALCRVDPRLLQILETVKLSVLIGVYDDEEQALRSFAVTDHPSGSNLGPG